MKRLVLAVVLLGAPLMAAQTLHVYGPGGPLEPMKECAALFTQRTHLQVEVIGGPMQEWLGRANANADVVYGGAEYMLTEFDAEHPGFLLRGSRVELGSRSFGILVRAGNPKHIRRFSDLAAPGVHILDVAGAGQLGGWEDIAGRQHLIGPIEKNVAAVVRDSGEAMRVWRSNPALDAWVTFASWGKRMPVGTEVVLLPEQERLSRGTPAAIASRSNQRPAAEAFLRFLQTPEAHAVFVRWGWD